MTIPLVRGKCAINRQQNGGRLNKLADEKGCCAGHDRNWNGVHGGRTNEGLYDLLAGVHDGHLVPV